MGKTAGARGNDGRVVMLRGSSDERDESVRSPDVAWGSGTKDNSSGMGTEAEAARVACFLDGCGGFDGARIMDFPDCLEDGV